MTEQMYETLHRMFTERYLVHAGNAKTAIDSIGQATERAQAMCYKSCLDMLEYAHNGYSDMLNEFDYFGVYVDEKLVADEIKLLDFWAEVC